jgi:hypothetical protein
MGNAERLYLIADPGDGYYWLCGHASRERQVFVYGGTRTKRILKYALRRYVGETLFHDPSGRRYRRGYLIDPLEKLISNWRSGRVIVPELSAISATLICGREHRGEVDLQVVMR